MSDADPPRAPSLRPLRPSDESDGKGLTTVVAEIGLDTPITLEALEKRVRSCSWCLTAQRIEPVRIHMARGGRWALAVFHAPDAESVRLVCRQAGFRSVRIWSTAQETANRRET